MHLGAVLAAGLDQLPCVVARSTAHDNDNIGLACHVDGRRLPLFRRLADGVEKAHVGRRKPFPNQRHQPSHLVNRLRRLGRHANSRVLAHRQYVVFTQHDVKLIEVTRQAAHFHMVTLPDDDDVVPISGKGHDRAMRGVHERARGVDDGQPKCPGPRHTATRCAMRRDHHRLRAHLGRILRDSDTPGVQRAEDRGIVDEVAEDGQGGGVGVLEREGDRVSYAEAHAEPCRRRIRMAFTVSH
jgi:hypothetical protein